ncbi:MAG: DUF5615 family PIN-like protein, partial [Rhodocyclaceae bacterium]|nr:DUF5615 family PIN-like protein [Rhodocyclaceae bacterium]
MTLLLDGNLSRRCVPFLPEAFPGSTQVALVGLERATDREVWSCALTNGFVIVSREEDFEQLASVLGSPPPFIWLRISNPSKRAVWATLPAHRAAGGAAWAVSAGVCAAAPARSAVSSRPGCRRPGPRGPGAPGGRCRNPSRPARWRRPPCRCRPASPPGRSAR